MDGNPAHGRKPAAWTETRRTSVRGLSSLAGLLAMSGRAGGRPPLKVGAKRCSGGETV